MNGDTWIFLALCGALLVLSLIHISEPTRH